MNIDASRPISSSVERAVAHVLKIKSQQSTSKTIEIKTGGSHPTTLTPIPIARKESHDVTPRTARARTKLAKELVQLLSGPSSEAVAMQTSHMIKSFDTKQRKQGYKKLQPHCFFNSRCSCIYEIITRYDMQFNQGHSQMAEYV